MGSSLSFEVVSLFGVDSRPYLHSAFILFRSYNPQQYRQTTKHNFGNNNGISPKRFLDNENCT